MTDYYFRLYLVFLVVIFLFALYHGVAVLLDGKTGLFHKFVAVLVIVYVLYLGMNRNTYLPFLGPTIVPGSLLKEPKERQAGEIEVKVEVKEADGTQVMYWASVSGKEAETPTEAYRLFENAGIATVKDGTASLYVTCPSSYKVPMKTLSPHIHYRVVYPGGLLGSVRTVYVRC